MGLHHTYQAALLAAGLWSLTSWASAQTPPTPATQPPEAGAAATPAPAGTTGSPGASQEPGSPQAPMQGSAASAPAPSAAPPPLAGATVPPQSPPPGPPFASGPYPEAQDERWGVEAHPAAPPPRELPYYEGEPAPEGYQLVERRRRGLVIAGALTFGVPYAISVSVAAGGKYNDKSGWLLIPVVGPFITAGRIDDCSHGTGACFDADTARGFAAFDGIAQAAGATMLIVGVALPKQLWVRESTAEVSVWPARVGREGYGLAAVGRF